MHERLSTDLDRQWAHFLVQLNRAYENAYTKVLRDAATQGTIQRVHLVSLEYPLEGQVEIGMLAIMKRRKGTDHA